MSLEHNKNGQEKSGITLVGLGYANETLCREVALSILRVIRSSQNDIHVSKVVLTGGDPFNTGEAESDKIRRRILEYLGKNHSCLDIQVERESVNTQQNAQKISQMLEEGEQIMLVGEKSHLPRANKNFDNAGIKPLKLISTQEVLRPMIKNPSFLTKRHILRQIQEYLGLVKKIFPKSWIEGVKRYLLR